MLSIPCTPNGSSCWTQRTALDGVDFNLRFDWYQRDGHWRLSIRDAADVPVRTGIVLIVDELLLVGVVDPRRPHGELAVIDTTGANDADPGFADLGGRFRLIYATAAEMDR
jgi:hypothetical protein